MTSCQHNRVVVLSHIQNPDDDDERVMICDSSPRCLRIADDVPATWQYLDYVRIVVA